MKENVHFLAVMVMVASLWLLFAGELLFSEILTAIGAGLATATGGMLLRKSTGHRQGGLILWARFIPGLFVKALKDSWTVSVALFKVIGSREPQGTFRRLPFERVRENPEDEERRVVATIGTTLQPNSYVMGFNKKRKEILIHQLVHTEEHPIAEEIRQSR